MILNAIVIKSDGSGNLTLLDTNPIFRNSSNKNVIYFYSPFSVANSIKIGFTLNNGVDTTTYPAFSSSATVDSLILPADQEPDYNIREFTMPSAITNQVAQKGATDTIMGFVESELQSSDDYLEPIVISDGVDVDGDLDTAFPSPAIGNFANVWNSSNNTFYSYLVMSVTPTVWANQSKLLNQIFTGTTGTIVLAINKAIATNDTDVDVTVTQLILEELAEQRQIIETLTSGGMSKSVYDTDDNGIVDKAETLDDDAGNTMTALEGKTVVSRVDQDLKISATPSFRGYKIYDSSGVEFAIVDFANGDFRVAYNGITKEYGKNLFVGIKARTIIGEGVVIQYDGAVGGGSDKIWAKIADKAEINVAPYLIIGVTTTTLTANEEQDINFYGAINEIDTTSYDGNSGTSADEGAIIYYDSVNGNGGMTLTKPEAPNVQVKIAVISAYHATSGQIKVRPSFGHFLGDAHDVFFNGHTFIGDEIMKYDKPNNRWHLDNLSNYSFPKTGWDLDVMTYVSIAFVNATRTFTLAKTGAVVDYWQENVKHTLDADKTVVIDDIEGQWFIYLNGDTLVASQTVWDLRADNRVPVSVVNWDATNKVATAVAYELHSWRMSGVDHFDSHFGLKTLYISGLGLSDTGNDTLTLTNGVIADEDILISIINAVSPSSYWEQQLVPDLKSYKYYRDGANGNLRRADDSTNPFYVVGNKVQLNPFSGGVWGLVDMTINKYGAGWVIVTSDITNPVKLFLGQEEADSLNDAIENNTITNLDLGTIPFEEILVAYRVIVKQINTAPYYEITQIDNMIVNPVTGETVDLVNSHGTLLGLEDDDHTHYYNATRINLWKISDVDPDLLLKIDKNYEAYTEMTSGGVVTSDIILVRDVSTGETKKMTVNEFKSWLALTGDIFDPTVNYASEGLGAYKSSMLTYHNVVLDTLGKYKIAIKTQVTDQILYIKMPTISSNQNDLQISTDDGTTYYDVLVNGGNIYAELVSEKLLKLQFDGSNFIIDLQSLSQQLTFDSAINSTYGTVAPINGSPQLNKFYGLSLNQPVLFGDFRASTGWSLVSNWSIASDVASYDGLATGYMERDIQITAGQKYALILDIQNGGGAVRLLTADGAGTSLFDEMTAYLTLANGRTVGIYTATANATSIRIYATASGGTYDLNEIMVIPITNTLLSTHTATQINAIIPTYFEGYTYIVNPELWSRGLQLFNEVDYTTVDYAYKIRVNPSSNVAWSVSTQYKLYDINENEISTSTALTVATTSETAYISFVGTISSPSTFMLNEGTTAEDYQAYNSPQDNFKLTTNLLSVGSIRDEAYEDNGAWWKKAYVGVIEDVAISDVIDTTAIPLILETTGVFYAVDSVNNEAQYGTYGDTLTLTGTSTVYYQLATQTTTAIEKDGSLIQEANTTLVQLNNFATSYTMTFALDSTAQRELDTSKLIYLQGEVDDNETSITTLDTEQIAQGVRITDNESDIGTIADLDTSATDLVEAVNEVHGEVDALKNTVLFTDTYVKVTGDAGTVTQVLSTSVVDWSNYIEYVKLNNTINTSGGVIKTFSVNPLYINYDSITTTEQTLSNGAVGIKKDIDTSTGVITLTVRPIATGDATGADYTLITSVYGKVY